MPDTIDFLKNFHLRLSKTGKEALILLTLLSISLLMRLPFISFPSEPTGDDYSYAVLALNILHKAPYFEIHPPLSMMIYSAIVSPDSPPLIETPVFEFQAQKTFDSFPFWKIRIFMALVGSLVPLLVYLIGRLLTLSRLAALLVGMLAALDGALIVYSRNFVPDMIMILFGLAGIACFLASIKFRFRWQGIFAFFISCLFFGLAISVKWTGAVFLCSAVAFLITKKSWAKIFVVGFLSILLYSFIFIYFISRMEEGRINSEQDAYKSLYVRELYFPGNDTLIEKTRFAIAYHKAMFSVNTDNFVTDRVRQTSNPIEWPVGFRNHVTWYGQDGKIAFTGNFASWSIALASILTLLITVLINIFKRSKQFVLKDEEVFILIAYLASYAPFFLMALERPMFPYHYMSALLFAFISIPFGIARLIKYFQIENEIESKGYFLALLAYAIFFVILFPLTYGF